MTDQTGSELKGKVAIVTGAGRMRGIGRGTATVIARMGAHVVVTGTGRDPDSFPQDEKDAGWRDIHSTAEQIESFGVSALPLVSNVADQDDVQKMIDAAAPYGNDRVSVMDMQAHIFKSIVDVKLMGTFYACKAAATQMVKQGEGGRIVNLSSTMGKSGRPNTSAYNAANFAVDGFTQALVK